MGRRRTRSLRAYVLALLVVPGLLVGSMKWSARAMSESFLLSNIASQVGNGFNRHIWKRLEEHVRSWTRERGELFVVTGPVFAHGESATIGDNHVAVPTHYYKVIFDPLRVDVIAFVLENASQPTSTLPQRIVSVDRVEAVTGLDFLSRLNDDVEDMIEAKVQPGLW